MLTTAVALSLVDIIVVQILDARSNAVVVERDLLGLGSSWVSLDVHHCGFWAIGESFASLQ